MSMIVANEWYRECQKTRAANLMRDFEADAEDAFAEEEKIYE